MARHLCFYNNDTLLQDNSEPGYFAEFNVPVDTNLIVCYDDDYKITCNIRVTGSSNQDMIYFQFATDSAIFLLSSIQNYTQNQTVRAQITVSNVAKDSNNLAQDIQNYLQNCGVGSGSSIDFSTIVTALNSIATALSALTNLTNLSNLSNLSQLANIITAINNQDNQSNIVDELRFIFTQSQSENSFRTLNGKTNISTLKGYTSSSYTNTIDRLSRGSFLFALRLISNQLSTDNFSSNNTAIDNNKSKLLARLFSCFGGVNSSSLSDINNDSTYSFIKNIETKLEQNLPFTTLAQVDVVTDYTQVVKGVGKNE